MKITFENKITSFITTVTFSLITEKGPITYIEYLNDKNKVIDLNLRDEDGDEIDDSVLLEEVQNFVDKL